jgi:hypothetical protein
MYNAYSTGPSFCRLWLMPRCSTGGIEEPPSRYIHRYRGDLLANAIEACAVLSDYLPLSGVLGLASIPAERNIVDDYKTRKPYSYPYNSAVDWSRYGSRFSSLNFLRQSLTGFSGEHEISHVRFHGDIEDFDPPGSELYLSSGLHSTIFGLSPAYTPNFTGNPFQFAVATGFKPSGYLSFEALPGFLPDTYAYHPRCDILDFVDYVYNYGDGSSYSPGGGWTMSYDNSVNLSSRNGNSTFLDLSYDFDMTWTGGQEICRSVWRVNLLVDFHFSARYPGTQVPFSICSIDPSTVSITNRSSTVPVLFEYTYLPSGYDHTSLDVSIQTVVDNVPEYSVSTAIYPQALGFFSLPPQTEDPTSSNLRKYKRMGTSDDSSRYDSLFRACEFRLPDIRPSSFFASSDCLHSLIDILKANNLENLSQLSGILEVLPSLSGVAPIIAKIIKRDPSAVIDLIDFLTSTVLKARFDTIPNSGDAIELITSDFESELDDLLSSSTAIGRGSSSYHFRDSEKFWGGEGSLRLVSRAKIRIRTDITTLLSTLLTLNGAGLLPTFSRSWDLVPFSFVVDWFANIGGRLQSIDDQLTWMAFTVDYTVFSYTVTYTPTSSELADFGLRVPIGGEPFSISWYRREPSSLVPRLSDSAFDYQLPKHGPNLATVGSLSWQVIRS